MSRELDQFGDLTRARRSRVDAVRRRIDQAVPTGSAVAGALVRIPTPGEDAVARVKAAVIAKNPRPVSGPAWGPMLGAALALLLVAGGGGAAWWATASGALAPAPEAAPTIVEHGGGALVGAADVVRTREAIVHGVTEDDHVVRGVEGTIVTGAAASRTTCLGPFSVHEADRTVCSPVSGAGLLALAEARREEGAAAEDVLGWLQRASLLVGDGASGEDAAVVAEVQAARVVTLHEAGETDAALTLAQQFQASGWTERADEVARVGAAIALTREDCPTAVPFLVTLAPDAFDAALALASCSEAHRTDALDHAERLASTDAERAAVEALR